MGQKNSCAILVFFMAAAIILSSCVGGDRKAGIFITDPADTVTPGTWVTDFVRDYSYAEGRIFDLAYPEDDIGPYDEVRVVLYEEETRIDNTEAKEVYLKTKMQDPAGGPFDNAYVRMRGITDDGGWELYRTGEPNRCSWALVFYASKRRALGVHLMIAHKNQEGSTTGDTTTIGYLGTGGDDMDTLRVLQPLAKDMIPSNPAWDLMWRNCYRVPRGVLIPELQVKVFKGLPGREGLASNLEYQEIGGVAGDPYIKILGLDQTNNSHGSMRRPDGMIDPFVEIHNPHWGLLIFPHREPFSTDTTFVDGIGYQSDALAELVPTLYHYMSRSERLSVSKYYLQVRTWQPDYIR